MVHNGIEYGDMQLIAEAYDILKRGLGLEEKEIAEIFAKVSDSRLSSSHSSLLIRSGKRASSTRS
jgi:6-phosphogluconate dehydrogenase